MTDRWKQRLVWLGALACLVPAQTMAQPAEDVGTEDEALAMGRASFDVRFGVRPDYGLDDGSELRATQYEISTEIERFFGEGWMYGWGLAHQGSTYQASGSGPIGASGLEVHVQRTRLFGHLGYQDLPGFGVFVGPSFELATELGANLEDAWMFGGFAGVTYVVDETLVVGVGVAASSQLEDGVQLLPIVLLDWRITDAFRLTTDGRYGPGGSLELIYDFGPIEAAIATSYLAEQYRLENEGDVPEGVVKETRVPVWIRVSTQATDRLRLDAYVETAFFGSFELSNREGVETSTNDFDPYVALGLNASFAL